MDTLCIFVVPPHITLSWQRFGIAGMRGGVGVGGGMMGGMMMNGGGSGGFRGAVAPPVIGRRQRKPGAPVPSVGDWECPRCYNVNFSYRLDF